MHFEYLHFERIYTLRRRGLVRKTVALAAEGRRFESTVW